MAQMKPHHKKAMERSHDSHKRSHEGDVGPTGHGVSEREGHVMGHGEFANMPHEVHMKPYPKSKSYRGGVMDDTSTGIDDTTSRSESTAQKHMSNQH
jgi:hypothetical protein